MPTYTFRNKENGMEWDDTMSHKDLDQYYIDNNCTQMIGAPTTVASIGDVHSKTTDAFKDRMKDIHKLAGRGSRMNKGIN